MDNADIVKIINKIHATGRVALVVEDSHGNQVPTDICKSLVREITLSLEKESPHASLITSPTTSA